jgi:hypothetical protein
MSYINNIIIDDQRRYGKFSYNDGSMYEGWWSDGTVSSFNYYSIW